MSAMSLVAAQEKFTATLKAVEDAARFAFRRHRRQDREEALAAARAAAWAAWAGLLRRGKDPVEVGVHAIARNAVRYVKSGRKLGNPTCGRGARDVWHPRAHRALGLRVVSFEELAGPPPGSWRQWLAEDSRVSPADEACFRLDFAAWLGGLPEKQRQSPSCWPRGTNPAGWPASSASRRRASANCGRSWPGAGRSSRGQPLSMRRAILARPAYEP